MSEAKHTAGPWQARSAHTAEDRLTIIANVDGEYVDGQPRCTFDVIAVCQDEYGEALPNAEANARLLIAAPDLLRIAKLMVACLQTDCGKAFRDLHPATWRQIQESVAQAEGRTP